jgi:hypothetical protein
MRAATFRERLREEAAKSAAAENTDPWRLTLERVRGKIDFYDRLERVSSQTLLDLLEVPQRNRTAGTYRRLAKVMAELGWTAVRVRDLTRGGYKEQVRGYCREAKGSLPCIGGWHFAVLMAAIGIAIFIVSRLVGSYKSFAIAMIPIIIVGLALVVVFAIHDRHVAGEKKATYEHSAAAAAEKCTDWCLTRCLIDT